MVKVRNIIIVVVIVAIVGFGTFMVMNLLKKEPSNNSFSINYYKFYSNNKFGVLDKNGKVVIDATYSDIIIPNPEKDVFFVSSSGEDTKTGDINYIIINKNNEKIFQNFTDVEPLLLVGVNDAYPYEKQVLKYEEDGKYGLVSYDGKIVTKAIYDELTCMEYKEGEFLVKKSDKYGVINVSGKSKIDTKYDVIMSDQFSTDDNGYDDSGYIVAIETNKDIFYGYVNSKGKLLTKIEYDDIKRIIEIKDKNNAYLIALKSGKYGVVQNDKEIISFNYQDIQYDEDSNLLIVKRNSNYGVLDMSGRTILPINYTSVDIEGIYIIATQKDKSKVKFDYSGVQVKNDKYKLVEQVAGTDYYTCQNNNYLYGVLDKDFNVLIPTNYDYIEYMFNDYFMVRNKDGKYGLINSKNQTLIDFKYDVMENIKDSKLVRTLDVKTNDSYIFDENLKLIFEGVDSSIMPGDGFIKVYCESGIRYFDLVGKEISGKEAYPNNALVSFEENGKWGFKDRAGNVVVEPIYDRVTEFNTLGFAGIKIGEKWGSIDFNGNVVVEPKYFIDDTDGDPDFLGIYYRTYFGNSEPVYTDMQ
ncbi:MAG: WG repeat-containing protein [Oscillospiraceae bacterium]|nr:WG repeat-containing protein [Oscillospiraceae bacterium]